MAVPTWLRLGIPGLSIWSLPHPLSLRACPALAPEILILRPYVPSIRVYSPAHSRCSVWNEGHPYVCALRGKSAWLGTGSAGRFGGVPHSVNQRLFLVSCLLED